ncbi:MAG: DUF4249 family protein [Bacteroidota bacterium]
MKKIVTIIVFFLLLMGTNSCEEKIDVPLSTAAPRLVIDAAIKWTKGTLGKEQKIKLSTTTNFYSNIIPVVSGAVVFITDADNTVFNFIETPGTGEYICTDFNPVINGTYVLTVIHNGQTYTAEETLKPVVSIERIEQVNDSGFTGDDIIIKIFFTDDGTRNDFYLFKFKLATKPMPSYGVEKDEFFQGNEIFGLYADENLEAGQNLEISMGGISERYYNYMNILLSISGGNAGSPFSSPPATVRGNIVNTTNDKNYALGYFSLAEVDVMNYIVE